jgi:hypothetical protein
VELGSEPILGDVRIVSANLPERFPSRSFSY